MSDLLSIPDLLLRPAPCRYEGPQGYLLRLAEANCMSVSDLRQMGARYDLQWLKQNHLLPEAVLDPDLHAHIDHMAALLQSEGRIWNQRYARFCPVCLVEAPVWHAAWELMFLDACPRHGVWMVDQCSSCRQPLNWHRESLLQCPCGSDLRTEASGAAPASLCRLAAALEARLLRKETTHEVPPILGLDLEQLQRLVRYLGGYLDSVANPKPLKLRNAGLLWTSWPVSTLAAEFLAQWPEAFHDSWSRMQDKVQGIKIGLKKVFKQAHYYLYRGLKEPAFNSVRVEFEVWLGANWKGTLSKRNWNLGADLLKSAKWIPGKLAAEQAGISIARLRSLIKEGVIEGQVSVSTMERRFLMVRRDQLDKLNAQLANEMTMTEAMNAMGIGKSRMQKLIKRLFPTASHINNSTSMPWCVPRSEVAAYLSIGDELPTVNFLEENQVSLAHVFKYWAWTPEEVGSLVEAVRTGELKLKSKLDTGRGISRWVFDTLGLRAWHANLNRGQATCLSIPEVAHILHIKQEVAYWLARNEYLEAEGSPTGRGLQVRRDQLERFRATYIFATEVTEQLCISPRTLISMLTPFGVNSLRGDGSEPCRQLVYRRSDIRRGLLGMGIDPSPIFESATEKRYESNS